MRALYLMFLYRRHCRFGSTQTTRVSTFPSAPKYVARLWSVRCQVLSSTLWSPRGHHELVERIVSAYEQLGLSHGGAVLVAVCAKGDPTRERVPLGCHVGEGRLI